MNSTRRIFLKSGALALASVGLAPGIGPSWLRDAVFAAEPKRAGGGSGGKKILVCVFLRGAMDGLSAVVPHGDPNYYKLRSTQNNGIAIARTGEGSVLDLDGHFGLHPALAPLLPIFKSGHMTAVHAVGSPHPTRSHFDAQDFMEAAAPGDKKITTGWLTRVSQACPEDQNARESQIRSIALSNALPRSFAGDASALAVADLNAFGVGNGAARGAGRGGAMMGAPGAAGGFESLYSGAVSEATNGATNGAMAAPNRAANGDVLHGTGRETFEAIRLLQSLDARSYAPSNGANYGNSRLGRSLQQIAQMIKADIGLELGFAETGGWDTHAGQGGSSGQLARRLGELSGALAAFYRDLGDRMDDVVVLTMSEFGRTARQNGNGGTDHGHGTCFLALGGSVAGGKVRGDWPGLAPEQLYENRDLAVTTDFRHVFGEVAAKHLKINDLSSVFPGYAVNSKEFRGVLRS